LNELTIYYVNKLLSHVDFQNAGDSHQSNFPLPVALSVQDNNYFIYACKGFEIWPLDFKM